MRARYSWVRWKAAAGMTHLAGSRTLIETLRPEFVFPQHFGTYQPTAQNRYWTVGYPDELRASLSPEMRARFHKLDQGVVFRIPGAT